MVGDSGDFPKDPKERAGQRLNFVVQAVRDAEMTFRSRGIEMSRETFDLFVVYDEAIAALRKKQRESGRTYVFTDEDLVDIENKGNAFISALEKRAVN